MTEAATLAGLIQRPSYFDPFRYPDRAIERRNVVLRLMHENGYISAAQYEDAVSAPLGLHPGAMDTSQPQYFLDVAEEEASKALGETQVNGLAGIYTTLEPVLAGRSRARHRRWNAARRQAIAGEPKAQVARLPQVALIALDPHTGEIKALIGGREYAVSQLDRCSPSARPDRSSSHSSTRRR